MNDWIKKIKRKSLGTAPREASPNIAIPSVPTPQTPIDNRFTGRTKQLGLRVQPEFVRRLKKLALAEECFLVEILEKALECYERERKN